MLDMAMSDFPDGQETADFAGCRTQNSTVEKLMTDGTFSGHHHAGHGVGDTGPSSQQCEPHDGVRDAEGLSCTGTNKISFRDSFQYRTGRSATASSDVIFIICLLCAEVAMDTLYSVYSRYLLALSQDWTASMWACVTARE